MAQLNLGQVVPSLEVTEVSGGKKLTFTTTSQTVETTINDGVDGTDGVSPTVEMSSTANTLTVTIKDAEGTKTKTVAKGTTIYYSSNDINATEVGTVWIV